MAKQITARVRLLFPTPGNRSWPRSGRNGRRSTIDDGDPQTNHSIQRMPHFSQPRSWDLVALLRVLTSTIPHPAPPTIPNPHGAHKGPQHQRNSHRPQRFCHRDTRRRATISSPPTRSWGYRPPPAPHTALSTLPHHLQYHRTDHHLDGSFELVRCQVTTKEGKAKLMVSLCDSSSDRRFKAGWVW